MLERLEKLRGEAEGQSVLKSAAFTIAAFDAMPGLIALARAAQRLDEHVLLNGGCHRGCPEHDDFHAALEGVSEPGAGEELRTQVEGRASRLSSGSLTLSGRHIDQRRVWGVLVNFAGAHDSDSEWVQFRQWFDKTIKNNRGSDEYRFIGSLGMGGKFWLDRSGMRVTCYPEDVTPERREAIDGANAALGAIWEAA